MFNGTLFDFVRRHATNLLPFMNIRKSINVVRALLDLSIGRTTIKSRPFVFRVDPSTACNLRCPECESHAQPTKELRLLPLKTFREILLQIKDTGLRLSLYDTGEPLVNSNLFSMVKLGNQAGLSTMVNSNLTLFRERHLDELADSGLTVLSASVDGVTQEEYQQYRKRGRVQNVLSALDSIVKMKRKTGKGPYLEVQVIDFDHLRARKNQILSYFRNLGADRVVWKKEVWGFNQQSSTEKTGDRCFWLYTGAMIRPDGELYPCCGRGFGRKSYGNLTTQSLDDIWNNKFYQFSRKLFSAGPDLPYSEEMKDIPCLECDLFRKKRGMRRPEFPATKPMELQLLEVH